jgi:hypothetical protein
MKVLFLYIKFKLSKLRELWADKMKEKYANKNESIK